MLAVVKSVAMVGLEGQIIDVEIDISPGLPALEIVGLPNASVRESKERVRAAIKNSGKDFPLGRITVNLAPADLRKEGPVFDLPIAVGIIAASGQLVNNNYRKYVFLGELSLDGSIRGVTGVLPSVLLIKDKAITGAVIVPQINADEAALVENIQVYPVNNLLQVVGLLNGKEIVRSHTVNINKLISNKQIRDREDMADVRGQSKVKRALEVSAAGGHNLIMVGPPGSGKTMMARRLAQILPPMSFEESLEVTKIYSISGLLRSDTPLVTGRPFRSPHHNISKSGMVGGGNVPKPGEISLAHYGILFMDEFPEFSRDTLESLRQPLEEEKVSISRVNGSVEYPAKMTLVAAMNPCPCGFLGDDTKECSCTPFQIARYKSRVSGPLLDRIDIQIDVPGVKYQDLYDHGNSEGSDRILQRVAKARAVQNKRFAGTNVSSNAGMSNREVRLYCHMDGKAVALMKEAFEKLRLSARAYSRVLKVSRTIADLQESDSIREDHVAEAIQYRSFDRLGANQSTFLY